MLRWSHHMCANWRQFGYIHVHSFIYLDIYRYKFPKSFCRIYSYTAAYYTSISCKYYAIHSSALIHTSYYELIVSLWFDQLIASVLYYRTIFRICQRWGQPAGQHTAYVNSFTASYSFSFCFFLYSPSHCSRACLMYIDSVENRFDKTIFCAV